MKLIVTAVLCAALVGSGSLVSAKEGKTTGTEQAKIKVLNNAKCPVSNEAAGSMQKGSSVDYKGYRIALCCNGCKEEFAKNPDAFLEKAKKDAAANKAKQDKKS